MAINFDSIFNFDEFDDFQQGEDSTKLNDGDRRVVTILFADIKGYTELSCHLDHEQVKIIVDRLLKAFTLCITQYGGYVDKYEGDLVMGLFGAKKASEQDTKRSILAAFDMIEAVKIFNKIMESHPKFSEYNIDFSIRVGINTGFVTTGKVGQEREGDFTVYGESVNMASRMETNAPINSILINEDTKNRIGNEFNFTPLGSIAIKGYTNMVEVFTVDSAVEEHNFWSKISTPCVGRDFELDILNSTYLKEFSREMIFLSGEAGIGKSRLIYEFLMSVFADASAELPQNLALKGYTSSIVEQPYYVFTNMLKRYFLHIDDKDNVEHDDYINFIISGEKNENIAFLNDREFQLNLSLSIKKFFDSVAKRVATYGYPLIIIVEDLHSIDEGSKMVFDYLLSKFILGYEDNLKTLFIFTSRDKQNLFSNKQNIKQTNIFLNNLERDKILDLVNSLDPTSNIMAEQKEMIISKSGGNPLFIEEWVKDLKGKDHNKIFVPESLNSLILSNIDRLLVDEKRLLQKASVVGKEFKKSFLAKVVRRLGVNYDFEEIFNALIDKEYFVKVSKTSEKDLYIFRKFSVHDVAYNTLLIQNREVIHSIVAECLEIEKYNSKDLVAYDLAYHYGFSNNRQKEIEYLFMAGKVAFKNFQNKKAVSFFKKIKSYQRKITIDQNYIYSIISFSDVYSRLGDFQSAKQELEDVIEVAKENNLKEQIAIANRCLGEIYIKSGKIDDALTVLNSSLEMSKEIQSTFLRSRTEGVIGEANFWLGNYEVARTMFENQYKSDVENNNKIGIIKVLGNLGLVYYRLGKLEESKDKFLEQINLALDFKDKTLIAEAYNRLGIIYISLEDYFFADTSLEQAYEIAKQTGDVILIAKVIGNMALVSRRMGNNDKALLMYKDQEKMATSIHDIMMLSIICINIGNIYMEKELYKEALDYFQKSSMLMKERGHGRGQSVTIGNVAICHFKLQDTSAALESLHLQLDIATAFSDQEEQLVARVGLTECYYHIGDKKQALEEGKQCIELAYQLQSESVIENNRVFKDLELSQSDDNQNYSYLNSTIKFKNSNSLEREVQNYQERIDV